MMNITILSSITGTMLDGSLVEVSLAKPVDRHKYNQHLSNVVSPYQSCGYKPNYYAAVAALSATR